MIESIKVEEINKDGTKTDVTPDKSATGYHNFLVAFNAIMDLDYAILRMIRQEYNDPTYIDQKIMNTNTKQIKELLLNRTDPNPVTICIKNKKTADNIYKEIMLKRYNDLISPKKYMDVTGIFFLISVYINLPNVHVTVLCASQKEADLVKRYHSKVNTLVLNDPSFEFDPAPYTDFIFKSVNDVLKFSKEFKEKRIAFLNYRFNITVEDDGLILPDVGVSKYMYTNGLNACVLVDTYRRGDPNYAGLKILIKKKSANN